MFEKDMHLSLLMDIYGALLSARKRELMAYYYDEDYSLAEIAEITGISRQGIRDSVKKSEAELRDLEDKLHLAERTQKLNHSLTELSANLAGIAADATEPNVKQALEEAVRSIEKLVL